VRVSYKSFVNGDNKPFKWEALWYDIVRQSKVWGSIPWILMCDFNVFRLLYKKRVGAMLWPVW
jgi:hypothetical protein